MKYIITTLGCKVNQYETQAMETILNSHGHRAAAPGELADAVIINTCAVTAESGRKSRQTIRRLRDENPGAVLAVSHDRYFLNAVCDHMAELRQTHLTQYTGNYDQFAVKREADLERQLKEYNMQQAEIERQEAIIRRYRMYNREKSIKLAESREKRLEKMERLEKPVDDQKVRFHFEARRRSGDDVLIAKDVSKSFGSRTLFRNFAIHLRAGDRVALIGPNGVGKTTLLNIITGSERADTGSFRYGTNVDIGYYDQQQASLHPEKDVMSEVWDDFPTMEPDRVRGTLALFLITGEDVFRPIATLSGGEMKRIEIATVLARRAKLSVFDEPEAGIDLWSFAGLIKTFTSIRQNMTGSLVIVSHQERILRIADEIVLLSGGRVTRQGPGEEMVDYLLASGDAGRSCVKGEAAFQ